MTATSEDVAATIHGFLARSNKGGREFDATTPLYGDGLGLDSLDAAELSAVLEDVHGRDPFSAGEAPLTVGDVLDFYR